MTKFLMNLGKMAVGILLFVLLIDPLFGLSGDRTYVEMVKQQAIDFMDLQSILVWIGVTMGFAITMTIIENRKNRR